MAFIYDNTTLLGRVRLYAGDSVEFNGPRPDGLNFDDSEMQVFIDLGTSLTGSLINCFMALAGEWSSFALSEAGKNSNFNAQQVADNYRRQADKLKDNPLELAGDQTGFIPLEREDAYS